MQKCRYFCATCITFFIVAVISCTIDHETEIIPRRVLFEKAERNSFLLSPDGKYVAYLSLYNGVKNIKLRPIDESNDNFITSVTTRGIFNYDWLPGSKHLVYIFDKNGNGRSHLYKVNILTKETTDLTPLDSITVNGFQTSYTKPNEILVFLVKGEQKTEYAYRINTKTDNIKMDVKIPEKYSSFTSDDKLRIRAAGLFKSDGGQQIWIRPIMDSTWFLLQEWGPKEFWGGPIGFSQDANAVRLLSSFGGNTRRLVEVDLLTNETRVLAEDPQYDLKGCLISQHDNTVQAASFLRSRLEWEVYEDSLKKDFDFLKKAIHGDISNIQRDDKDRIWIVEYSFDDRYRSSFIYNRWSHKIIPLFDNNTILRNYQMAHKIPFSFKARDGMLLHGFLTMPVDNERKAPAVLLVHGGPWSRDTWEFDPVVQLLANRGYAVLQINFRGSSGYGKVYENAGDREWGRKMHYDLLDGVSWAVHHGYIKKDKIAIMGQSYGGYAALIGLTNSPEIFKCGIAISSPTNLISYLKTTNQRRSSLKWYWNMRVGDPLIDTTFLKSISPLFQVKQIKDPLLLIHGAKDKNVIVDESRQLAKLMTDSQLPIEYLEFSEEAHNIYYWNPENLMNVMASIEMFLNDNLGGRYEPIKNNKDHKNSKN